MNYTIGDFLIRIKNAYCAHKTHVINPYSKVGLAIGNILVSEGFLKNIREEQEDGKRVLIADLLYHSRQPTVRDVKLVSKPSIHRYVSKIALGKTMHDYGINIVSTSLGMMTAKDARKKGVGGELVAKVLR